MSFVKVDGVSYNVEYAKSLNREQYISEMLATKYYTKEQIENAYNLIVGVEDKPKKEKQVKGAADES